MKKTRVFNFNFSGKTSLLSLAETTTTHNMASRILANLLVAGSGALFRAASQAWQKALENARKSGVAADAASSAAASVRGRQHMSLEEARKILNVTDAATKEEMLERFAKTFEKNEGASFYVQSKLFRAKETLGVEQFGMSAEEAGRDPRIEKMRTTEENEEEKKNNEKIESGEREGSGERERET
jgi:import inner membrane translocase subunit TIM16